MPSTLSKMALRAVLATPSATRLRAVRASVCSSYRQCQVSSPPLHFTRRHCVRCYSATTDAGEFFSSSSQHDEKSRPRPRRGNGNKRPDLAREHQQQQQQPANRVNVAKESERTAISAHARNAENTKPRKAALLLPRAMERMESFLETRAALPPPPSDWLLSTVVSGTDVDATEDSVLLAQRIALHNDVVALLLILRDSILGGHISPRGGSNSLILSDLLGNILLLLGESPPAHLVNSALDSKKKGKMSPANAAGLALDLLHQMNLDVTPDHYASAIRAACHDGRWSMASNLFSSQVDPDSAGLVPVDPTLGFDNTAEMGLYAIARQSQIERQESGGDESGVADKVFDAALSMSIISPADQDNYVLAAGSALGRAGEWKECVSFMKTGDNAERLGQTLVAATMLACVECSQYDVALEIYNNSTSNPSLGGSEWQYGGGYDIVHPLARDLALCAMGRSTQEGLSSHAMDIFLTQIVKDGERISTDALSGLFMSFERDGDWSHALDVFHMMFRNDNKTSGALWTIVSDSINVLSTKDTIADKASTSYVDFIDGNILSSVMNACNASGEYGLALLFERILGLGGTTESPSTSIHNLSNGQPGIVNILFASYPMKNEHVHLATMASLCGLGCYEEAVALYENDVCATSNGHNRLNASLCAEYAKAEAESLDSVMSMKAQAWRSAFRHMHRVTSAVHLLRENGNGLSGEEVTILANALGHCISCCNDAGQPRAGLALADYVSATIAVPKDEPASMGSTLLSLFGLRQDDDLAHGQHAQGQLSRIMEHVVSSDVLLCATMRAYRMLNKSSEAIDLFFDSVEEASTAPSSDAADSSQFIQSWNEAIAILFHEGKADEATNLFNALEDLLKTPDTYTAAALGLAALQDWKGVGEVYSSAVRDDCLTEDVALIAMKSIVEQEMDGKIPTLRAVVDEVSKIESSSSEAWIKSRYWALKRELGWRFARLLMWWNDPSIASEEEFLLAIEHLEFAKRDRVIPKNDDLRCIVRYASFHMRFRDERNSEGNAIEDDESAVRRSQIVELLLEAVFEARRTNLGKQTSFIDSAASGFRALQANHECIQFVRDVLSRGIRVNKRTLVEALNAAEDIGDGGAVEEMSAALCDAGYNTSRGND